MFQSKRRGAYRLIFILAMLALLCAALALTLYCANISALNVPQNYRGVFV